MIFEFNFEFIVKTLHEAFEHGMGIQAFNGYT